MPGKILVVDDEPHIVKLLESRLTAEGYEVIVASDGKQALDKVRLEHPHLIILDIMLPGMDGYEVCRLIRAEKLYAEIPIIMLTARRETLDIAKGMQLGAVSYIQKPFKSEVLLGIIKGLVKK